MMMLMKNREEETKSDGNAKWLSEHVPTTIKIMLVPDCSSTFNDCTSPLHLLCFHDLCHLHALQSIAGEGTACGITDISFDELPVRFMEELSCDADMADMVYHLQTSGMTDKDCLLKCFTCHQLGCLKNWHDWDRFFDAQLDSHCKVGCIGIPVSQPTLIDDYPPNIPQWTKQLGLILLTCKSSHISFYYFCGRFTFRHSCNDQSG